MLKGAQRLTRGHRVHVNAINQIGDDEGATVATDDRITAKEALAHVEREGALWNGAHMRVGSCWLHLIIQGETWYPILMLNIS